MTIERAGSTAYVGVQTPHRAARTIPVFAFGMGLSLFVAISFVLCVVGYLVFPSLPINHTALSIFLPGFELLTWPSFFLGLFESVAYGWYVALIFGPLYNFFVLRWP
jgi:hypothetical protein